MEITNNFYCKKFLLLVFMLLSYVGFAQVDGASFTYTLANPTNPTPNTLEFDVMLVANHSGTALSDGGLKIRSLQYGVNFNPAIINGGTPSTAPNGGSFVLLSGTRDAIFNGLDFSGPNGIGSYRGTVNGVGQLRVVGTLLADPSASILVPNGTYRIGRYRFTNTVAYTANSNAQLWINNVSTNGSTLPTVAGIKNGFNTPTYLYGLAQPALTPGVTAGFSQASPLSLPLNICSTSGTASNLGAVTCYLGTNGSATITMNPVPSNLSVNYQVDGGPSIPVVLTAGGAFNITTGLTVGAHTVTITGNSPCTSPIAVPFTILGPVSQPTNSTTITACDNYTWSVTGTNYTTSGTYTGTTVDANGCTVDETLILTITPLVTPTFAAVAAICSGESLSSLPTSSTNLTPITGTWAPALNNLATTTYTFTPDIPQCATTATLTITVHPNPTLTTVSSVDVCVGNSTNVTLSGLLPNTAFVATYTVGAGPLQTQAGTSSPTGTFTFATSVLTMGDNGLVLEVTKLKNDGTNCETVFSGITTTLVVNPNPTLSYAANLVVYTEGSPIMPSMPTITGFGPFTYAAISLPPGLSIDSFTGVISGTPTAPTVLNNYTITVSSGCGSTSTTIAMTINAIPFAGGGCSLLNNNFSTNPQLANTNVNGAWYPDRYRPANFVSDGSQLKISINPSDGAQLRPSGFNSGFYNTQGRKFNQCGGCATIAKADLYIPSDWATNKRRTDLWVSAYNASNVLSFYGIIGFRNVTGSNPQMSVWNNASWTELGAPAAYDTSYALEIRLNGANLEYLINNIVVATFASGGSVYFGDVTFNAFNFNDSTLGVSYDASSNNAYDAIWDNVFTASSTGNLVTNTTTGNTFCSIQSAISDASTLAGHTLEVASSNYNEQVLVNKAVVIKGVGMTQPTVNFTGTPSGKPTLFDISVDGVTIENLRFNVDLSKLRSAIIASASGLDNVVIKDNVIDAYGTPAGSYGDRNAVSVNYTGTTNYRVANAGVNNVVFTGNTVNGSGPASYFRSGISADEVGLTATGNTLTTINHDILLRFASNGANTISNNTFNGGGLELTEQNAGSGLVTVSNNTFTGTGAPGAAVMRIKNNNFGIAHLISSNTFTNFNWAISLENMNSVTLNANTFTGTNASSRAVVVNTKSISSNSNAIVQVPVSATMTNNIFAGMGIGLTFQNHDSDNDSYGSFTIGTAGNANSFAATLSDFVRFDNQTGTSTGSTFPTYPGTGGWPTTMACWDQNIDIQNNTFDIGGGLQSPLAMTTAERVTLEGKLFNKPDASCTGLLIYFLPVTNTTQNLKYLTISEAIAAANPADVITVGEGTYAENIIVTKPLTILGPNALVNACSGTRVAEAVLTTAVSDIAGGSAYSIVDIQASNVTISGFTIDGDNPLITTGKTSTTGADIDIAVGLTRYVTGDNTVISNNIIKNVSYFGVELYDYPAGVASSGNVVSNNKIQDLGTYDPTSGIDFWGGAVLLYNNQYASVTNNCMTNVRLGVQTGNFYQANPGVAATISNNTIQARRTGIFHNLHYGASTSPINLNGNTITALNNSNESRWYGIGLMSMGTPGPGSTASGNIIDGSGTSVANIDGVNIWNCQAITTVSGGTITGVKQGVNVNNFEGFSSNAGNSTSAIIDNVTITGATLAGVMINDNPSNTNGDKVSAEVRNCTISGSPTSIFVSGIDAYGNIHDNTINATAVGINVNGATLSASNALTVQSNAITSASQVAGGNPTVAVSLNNVSGSQAATILNNTISGSYYGYLVYNVNTTPVTKIAGGAVTGVMQGIAAINVDPLTGSAFSPSTIDADGISMSGFTGDYPAQTGRNFHAGVYVFTGGSNTTAKITSKINNVSVSGTGKTSNDSAGMSFADFSTGAGNRQDISVTASTISNNLNRGINVRGANALVDIATSTLTGNGNDPIGTGGNNGFGIIGRVGAVLNVHNNFITNPATATLPVTGILSDGAAITAFENKFDNNGNTSGKLVVSSGNLITATCNRWGVDCADLSTVITGNVTYQPFLSSDADSNGAAGFQPAPGSCNGNIATMGGLTTSASPVCEGTGVSFTATGLVNGESTFNYTVTGPGGPFNGNQTVTVAGGSYTFAAAAYPVGTYNITINSIQMGDCSTIISTNNTASFTVKPNPTIGGVSPSAAAVCDGTAVSVTATGLVDGITDFTYTINGNPGSINGINVSGGSTTFAAASYPVGTYNIVIISATIDGCITTFSSGNTTSFTVNPNPTLSTVTTSAVCEGNEATIVLSGMLPNTSSVITYTFDGSGPLTQTGTTSPTGTFSFTTPLLTMDENGSVIEVTNLINDVTGCDTNFTGKTVVLVVGPIVVPTFAAVTPICAGGSLTALPTTSIEGITGTWSPDLDNTSTTDYVFTPDETQCATTAILTIVVNPIVTPSFDAVPSICVGASLSALPTSSNNGITGTWTPALDNSMTTTYTFTPDSGQCATTTTLTINVNAIVTPTFAAVAPIVSGDTLAPLPTTSINGISGTWSPAINNTTTTTYTFTPGMGQCGTTTTLTITVNPNITSIGAGDFRSVASGSWGLSTTWQRYNGSVWQSSGVGSNNPGQVPSATSSVYLQTGHTVSLTANAACKDLHLNAAAGQARLALSTFTLSVNGKMRAYTASLNTVPGTSTATLPSSATWITATTGKIAVVGDSRALTTVGEWGAGNAGIASPSGYNFELNLNVGQTVTANTSIKARTFNIAAGTLKVAGGSNRLSPDAGAASGSNFTIQNGGVLESDATGTAGNAVIGRTAAAVGGTLSIMTGGTLVLTGSAPTIAMTTITNNGTVSYPSAGNQTLAAATNSGAAMSSYANLDLSGGSIKSLKQVTFVSKSIGVENTTTLNNDGFNLSLSSESNNNIAGIITGAGALIKTGAGTLTLSAVNGNNTAHTYTGTTTVNGIGTGSINVAGLANISATALASDSQSVTFSSATPANGNYQLLPGMLAVGTQSFSASPATPTKSISFNYNNGTVTVSDATITTGTISPATYCAGANVSVAFTSNTVLSGTYTAQLSDASGSFSAPVAIGTGTISPISATIPGGTAAGLGYRIRVVSIVNAITGSDNGADINVDAPIVPTFMPVAPICAGDSFTFPTSSMEGITGSWTPAFNNTVTTIYTFVPDSGQCATGTTLTVPVVVCQSVVNLKLFVQGYYLGAGEMDAVKNNQDGSSSLNEVEDLTIELHDATTFALVVATDATLLIDGTLSAVFPTAPSGSFYIVVKGSNIIETWSAMPQTVGALPLDYDFSTAASQAYTDGSQSSVVEVEPGVWAMYSGDVNQNQIVDIDDVVAVQNDSDFANFGVLATDLNGDGVVDSFDFSLVSNNSDAVIFTQRP